MSAQIRRYVAERQNFEFERGWNEEEQVASDLRQNFLKTFIIGFDTNLYKTQEERDWAYLAKREYHYDVILKGIGYSIMFSNLFLTWRIFVNKKMVFWPLAIIPASYFFISPILLQKHSKKIFDMCNLGEQFYLGRRRNEVLKQCNSILKVEDF